MQYALLIYSAAEASTAADLTQHSQVDNWIAYTRALKDAEALVTLAQLQPVESATSVRVREGEQLLTDGPFIETKEHLLGFYLVEAPNLDAALNWAARMPLSRFGTVEVRPVQPTPVLDQIVRE
jgi:hypothetical protein